MTHVETHQRLMATALGVALLAMPAAPARAAEQSVELRSDGGYTSQRLPAGTRDVDLDRQLSGNCRFNRSWGYDLSSMEIWVNNGCSARFTLSGDFSDSEHRSSNSGAAIAAVAAIAGLALLASHHKDRERDDDRPDDNSGGGYGRQLRSGGGLCLDISGRAVEGARAIVFGCHNGSNQRFDWGRGGELKVSGLCLDVAGGNSSNGAEVIAFRCNGGDNQRWQARGNQIRSRMNGKCLDVRDGRLRPGQAVQLWDCNGGDNQRWWW